MDTSRLTLRHGRWPSRPSCGFAAPFAVSFVLAALPDRAFAQAPAPAPALVPTGKGVQAPATAGKTEIAGQGNFAQAESKPADNTDATQLDLAGGGILSTGNARSLALTGNGLFRLRRKIHQFGAQVAGNYGRAAPTPADDQWKNTVGNVQGAVRYDVFLHDRVSAFLMTTARHDRFQGLDLRLNIDPGFAAYVLTDPKHRLWFEAGYDFQYDRRYRPAIVEKDAGGNPILGVDGRPIPLPGVDRVGLNHAVRLYGGYSNRLDDRVTLDTGLEYLQSVLLGPRFRLNWNTALSVALSKKFSLAATFTLRYENRPLPGIQKLDTITAMNVVYRFF